MAEGSSTANQEENGSSQSPEAPGILELFLQRKLERDQARQREEESRKTLLEGKPVFFCAFGANPVEDDSCISSVRFPFRISKYQCLVCKGDSTSADFAYPHLDPSEILDRDELRTIEGKSWTFFEYAPDQDAVIKCVKRLSERWLVPVTSFTSLGPVRLTIGRGVKYDFRRLLFSSAFLVRKNAVELLQREGFDLDFAEVENRGKLGAEANYVQLVIPVTAHEAMPEGAFYCEVCKRMGFPSTDGSVSRL